MPTVRIHKSITIQAPLEKLYTSLCNLREWPAWSPWLIAEPGCKLTFSEDGHKFSWKGRLVGVGRLRKVTEEPQSAIHYQLTFRKPKRMVAKVRLLFEPRETGVEVTWTMETSVPFFLFFIKPIIETGMGMDSQRGLNNLKDLMETDSIPSRIEFLGAQNVDPFRYVGLRCQCAMAQISDSMESSFARLDDWLEASGVKPTGAPVSIYHKFKMMSGTADYTAAIPVIEFPIEIPSNFSKGVIEGGKCYSLRHVGPYRHLGNAWSSGMMHGRAKRFRSRQKQPAFEIYHSDPKQVPENKLTTTIYMPMK